MGLRKECVMFCVWLVVSQFAWVSSISPIIRREVHDSGYPQSAVDIGVHGEFEQLEHEKKIYPNGLGYRPPEETCNDDFILGINNSNDCLNSTYHRKILDIEMCRRARELNGAGIEENFFILDWTYIQFHPQGCFVWPCGQTHGQDRMPGNTTMCYFYNPNGNTPTGDANGTISGPPVCYRAEYLNGTIDQTPNCDPGYENIMDEKVCRSTATCLGYTAEEEFRVGEWNWSKHEEYPKGCFIRKDTGAFQFNNISSLDGRDPERPGVGGGTPVCNVSSIMTWDPSIAVWGDHRSGWESVTR